MKTLKISLFLITILFFFFSKINAQTDKEAYNHMVELTNQFNEMKKETWQYMKALTKNRKARKIEKKRKNLIKEIKSVESDIKKNKSYKSDESLKNAMLEYLNISHVVLKEDFDKILDMEEIAEQSYDNMETYVLAKEKANEKLNDAFEIVKAAQKSFAMNHNINLVDGEGDKMTKKIKKAADALKYYNQVYLIFFKPYKQEAYLIDAQNRNDVSGMEQNSNALKKLSEEALDQLKDFGNYKDDVTLKAATHRILKFYKNEAEDDYPIVIDFYMKKDKYEKLKKTMESKKKKEITQEDVDKYNKAVKEFNNAVKSFNEKNDKMNKERTNNLEEWNKKVEDFFDKHAN